MQTIPAHATCKSSHAVLVTVLWKLPDTNLMDMISRVGHALAPVGVFEAGDHLSGSTG